MGSFAYSPIYFYLKKEEGKVTEVSIIDIPAKFKDFIGKIREYSGLKLDNIDVVPRLQVKYHFQLTDLDDDFEIDQDLKEQAEEDAKKVIEDRQKAKIAAEGVTQSK